MNVFCIVGKLKALPELKETPQGIKTCTLMLEVERPFANSEGIYEADKISVEVWRGMAETVCDICKLNANLAIKGRIAAREYKKDDAAYIKYSFVAEKINFIK